MACPFCGGEVTQQQLVEQQLAFARRWLANAPAQYSPLGYEREERGVQACRFFDQNPQLSGWRDTAAEWSKIP